MARYLITGGAGFLGINLARYLLANGEAVTSLDLAPFDYPDTAPKVTAITGDIRHAADVSCAMRGVDVVVHAAAALPLYSKADIFSTDIDGTRTVLETAFQSGVKHVIHISTTAVYGLPDHHPLLETDVLNGVGDYGVAKIAAEELCNTYREKGLCVTIFRPKSFIGAERLGVFSLLYDWAAEGHGFPVLGSGNNRYQYLDVEDFCAVIYLAANLAVRDPDSANDTFNIGAKDFGTVREDFQAVLDAAGYGKKIRPVPAAPVIAVLRLLEILNLSPLYRWVYETIAKDSFVSIEKAERVLGFRPRYSNRDALLRNFHWYLDNKTTFQSMSGISHRVPWKQGVLGIVKAFF